MASKRFSVKAGEADRDGLIVTMPARAYIFYVTSVKEVDFPGFEPDLTEKGLTGDGLTPPALILQPSAGLQE